MAMSELVSQNLYIINTYDMIELSLVFRAWKLRTI